MRKYWRTVIRPSGSFRNSASNFIIAVLLLMIPLLGTADSDREKSIGSHLMCICGCLQTLTECNHIHCPSSVPMRTEVKEKVAAGLSDDLIYASFSEKYGKKVLPAPPFKGVFYVTAWLLSLAVLLAGGAGLIFYLRRLKLSTAQSSLSTPSNLSSVDSSKMNQKIEDELNRFTPED